MAAQKCSRGQIPPKIAQFFHSLPHVNFNFDNVSSIFKPNDADYQQNFWLYSGIPVLCGALLFLILIITFLTFCCSWCHKLRTKQISKRKSRSKCAACLALLLWLASVICCGSIIAGFVFNDDIDRGVENVTAAVKNVTSSFDNIQNKVSGVQDHMLDIQSIIKGLIDSDLPDVVREILQQIKETVFSIIHVLRGIKKEQAPDVEDYITTAEYYRWWAAFGILDLGMLVCLFTAYSTIRHSRCGFAMVILFGCVAFLLDWALLGSHLGASIAMSDLCINPRKTIDFYISQSSPAVRGIVDYYVECKPNSEHPFEQYVRESLDFAQQGQVLFEQLEEMWPRKRSQIQELFKSFNQTKTDLIGIQKELKCAGFQRQYEKARCAVCFPVVEGLSKLLLISIILVVFSAVLLLLIIPMCKRIHRRKRTGNAVVSMLSGEQSLETEYHSVPSDDSDESLPLVPSSPPPACPQLFPPVDKEKKRGSMNVNGIPFRPVGYYTKQYEAIARSTSVDYQFHSFEEDRNPVNPTQRPEENNTNNTAPPPPRGEIVNNPRRIAIMAF